MSDETSPAAADVVVPLAEEHITVSKRQIAIGRVRVTTSVETVQEMAHADLTSDTAEVTRVTIGQSVTGALPEIRQEGDVTIIPIFEEVLVVEKRLFLKEEIRIRRQSSVDAYEAPVSVRRQSARIDRLED